MKTRDCRMSLNAYKDASQKTEKPQQTEYRLFVEVTRELMAVAELAKLDSRLHEALHWNRRMWSTFATDCAIEGNKLPKMLRAQIISLSIWVGKYSSQVIHDGEDIQALIDVNKAVMEGLAMQEQNAAQNEARNQTQNQQKVVNQSPPTSTSIEV